MKGARVLVVGASAGIGRAFAVAACGAGAEVLATARRADALGELDGCHAVVADVTTTAGREAVADATHDRFDALDLLLYAAGRADLDLLVDTDEDSWRRTFDLNVIAFNELLRQLGPHLAPTAVVAALSSDSASAPRSRLVAYAASKAALETTLAGWRIERPGIRFSAVAVGPTQPTDIGNGFRAEVLGPALDDWARRGLVQQAFMATDEVAAVLLGLYAVALENPSVGVEHVTLRSPTDLES